MKITEAFERGEFVVTAEVGPPKGFHIEHVLEEAKTYLSGITAVNVTEWIHGLSKVGTGRMRMHGLSLQFVKEGLGEKPICSGSDTGGWAFFA